MQHGTWRVEVEPVEKKKEDVFLHVMVPCDEDTLMESQASLKEKVHLNKQDDKIILEIRGKSRVFRLSLDPDSPDARIFAGEADNGGTILDHLLTQPAIKARAANR